MAIQAVTVGPGSLSFTSPAMEISSQVTKCVVTPSQEIGDTLHVLSGESIAGEAEHAATLDVSAISDLTKSGFVAWSWANAGKTVTFTYTPNTKNGLKVSGQCVVAPVPVGGDVKQRATTEFSFTCPTLPTLTPPA